jgi:hypothetical protein
VVVSALCLSRRARIRRNMWQLVPLWRRLKLMLRRTSTCSTITHSNQLQRRWQRPIVSNKSCHQRKKNTRLQSSHSQRSWAASPVAITRNVIFLRILCVSRPCKTMLLLLTSSGSLHQCPKRSNNLCKKSGSMLDTTQALDWHRDTACALALTRNVSCFVGIRS